MTFRCGDIVLLPFPFTDLSAAKRRPALLLKSLGEFGDWLCLPVTTQGSHAASLSMCKALECAGHQLMEPTAAAYRP